MTDRPIIFSASMILALLQEAKVPGTGKTQTRRLETVVRKARNPAIGESTHYDARSPWTKAKVGDRLWARENLCRNKEPDERDDEHRGMWAIRWSADNESTDLPWAPLAIMFGVDLKSYFLGFSVPSIHMPKALSRLTMPLVDVRLQRLQDITDEDAIAEGIVGFGGLWGHYGAWVVDAGTGNPCVDVRFGAKSPREAFSKLWNSLHSGRDIWEANPRVIPLTFTVQRANVDQVEKVAA